VSRLVIIMDGGLIQNVLAYGIKEVEDVVVIDYDVEGEDEDRTSEIREDETHIVLAAISRWPPEEFGDPHEGIRVKLDDMFGASK
jgi:hypothetical protein